MEKQQKISEIDLEIPYTSDLNKNNSKRITKKGKYYTTPAYKQATETVVFLLQAKLKANKVKFKQNKVWIEIFLQKPRKNCDVANFVDGIADIVKQAILVDDSFFSIKADWEFSRDIKPYIVITIRQK